MRYGTVLVSGNTVYGQDTSGQVGIWLDGYGPQAIDNTVFDNDVGIQLGQWNYGSSATAMGNRVYSNTTGIVAYRESTVQGNTVYSNGIGIQMIRGKGAGALVANNLIYDNTDQGIRMSYGTAQLLNNTIYQPTGDAVRNPRLGTKT